MTKVNIKDIVPSILCKVGKRATYSDSNQACVLFQFQPK